AVLAARVALVALHGAGGIARGAVVPGSAAHQRDGKDPANDREGPGASRMGHRRAPRYFSCPPSQSKTSRTSWETCAAWSFCACNVIWALPDRPMPFDSA